MPFATTNDGVQLFYEERGARPDRPTLVFAHGACTSTRWFANQLEALSGEFHCVAYDARSHGQSEKVPFGHRTARYAHDLSDLLQALSIDDAILIGWSMGGHIVLSYVDLFGTDRVAGIVIVDLVPIETNENGWELGYGTDAENEVVRRKFRDDQANAAPWLIDAMFHQLPGAADRAWMEADVLKVPPMDTYRIIADTMRQDVRDLFPRIDVPLQIIAGAHGTYPEAGYRYMLDHIPDAGYVALPESGHCPFLEEPAAFNEALRSFAEQADSRLGGRDAEAHARTR